MCCSCRLRGAEDPTNPVVIELTRLLRGDLGDQTFDTCYLEGAALDGQAAVARVDPDSVGEVMERPPAGARRELASGGGQGVLRQARRR